MSNVFLVSVCDCEIMNRNSEVFAKGKTLIDSSIEKDVIRGGFRPRKKLFKMTFSDCEYFNTKEKPYPEKIKLIGQIVSVEPHENEISTIEFYFNNIYLYNSYKNIEKILDKAPSFELSYSDRFSTIIILE